MTTTLSHTSPSPSSTYTRLHITPLDKSLLEIIVPASILPQARRISYHTIETFPEKRYGFIELPVMDAEKLKKKLNGATLKGTKIRVEQAKPDDIPEPLGAERNENESQQKKKSKSRESKKRKREEGVLVGVELTDRKIKRGWTSADEPKLRRDRKDKEKKDKKRKKDIKSKYTNEPEMLFKTRLPPTAAANGTTEERRKKRKKGSRQVVVHEFEHTTKVPTFIKSSAIVAAKGSQVTEFVEGKGWVDSNGNVVEEAKPRTQPGLATATPKPKKVPEKHEPEEMDTSSEDETSSDASDDPEEQSNVDSVRPMSSASTKSLTIKIPPATPAGTKVHPLEALYKKTGNVTPAASKDESSFNFFGDAPEEDESESLPVGSQVPMTPYTRQDLEFRNMRSAAPTPDTAYINKTFRFWPSQDDVDEEEGDGEEGEGQVDKEMVDISQTENRKEQDEEDANEGSTEATEFQKAFYAQRSDINKAWRAARKASRKEKRYRENKSRGSRVY